MQKVQLFLFFYLLNSIILPGQSFNSIADCMNVKADDSDCLVIGGLGINSKWETFDKLLGKSTDVQSQTDTTYFMYKLQKGQRTTRVRNKHLKRPYILVAGINGVVTSIQLSGHSTKADLNFYGISLGSPTDLVISSFGNPDKVIFLDRVKADEWRYEVKGFSFMILHSKVVGVRVARR